MSGKGEGKKRNREAQSEQHGFQESPIDRARKSGPGESTGTRIESTVEKERVLEKMRELEERRRKQEGEED